MGRVDPVKLTLDQLQKLRDDIAPQAARRSHASVRRQINQLRSQAFFIAQCALATSVAWAFARYVVDHKQPFFTPIAAIIYLGFSFNQHLHRVTKIIINITIKIKINNLFVRMFNTGIPQLIFVITLAMSVAVLLGAGNLMTTQASIQTTIVTTLLPNPNTGFSRWQNTTLSGLIALAATTITPTAAIRHPQQQAAGVLNELAEILNETANNLHSHNKKTVTNALRRTRANKSHLDDLHSTTKKNITIVRLSPFQRRHHGQIQKITNLIIPLDRAIQNTHILIQRCAVSVWRDKTIPTEFPILLERLANDTHLIGESLFEPAADVATHRILSELNRHTTTMPLPIKLSAVVVLGQLRSTIIDLLELTNTSYDDARKLIPLRPDKLDKK